MAACGAPKANPTSTAPLFTLPADPHLSWVYWLQDVDLDRLRTGSESIVVVDYSRDGTDATAFSSVEIEGLKRSPAGQKTVLAYMSIGEAEAYRFYWRAEWRSGSPGWLEEENPAWAGNYKVRFWAPEWQRIIFGGPDSYLDRLLAAGFDRAYLDIVDAYEYFREKGRESSEAEMVRFVTGISAYAKARNPRFLIVPQNAPELGRVPGYLTAVDGIAQEGVYYGYEREDHVTPAETTRRLEEQLDVFGKAGKLVLVVDYAVSPAKVRDAYQRAWAKGYMATVTTTALERPPLGP